LVGSIPIASFSLLLTSYLGYIPFQVELHTVVTIGIIALIFLFFIPHNASYSACRVSKNIEQMKKDLEEELNQNALKIMGKTKSTLTVQEFISSYFQNIRNDNFAKVASSIFPMLGILGTFVAIAISMPDFTVTTTERLDREITILLSGVGTAFYASIFGIFLSLWWIFFERRGLGKIEQIVAELETLYNPHIWQKSELTKHQHIQMELRDQEIIKALKEAFSLDYVKELHNQYLKSYQEITDETNRSIKLISERMYITSKDLRRTLLELEDKKDSVRAEKSLRDNLEGFVEASKMLQDSLTHFDKSVEKSLEKIDYELASAVDRLGRMTEYISLESEKLKRDLIYQESRRRE
jgi:biopolymer transport protein ExbB/TolQ